MKDEYAQTEMAETRPPEIVVGLYYLALIAALAVGLYGFFSLLWLAASNIERTLSLTYLP